MVKKSALFAPTEGKLVVTCQQSRFHVDAVDDPKSKEILVKDLNIAIGNKEVLSHVDLHLQPGRRYVLVGRNGIGKSTLLQAIASGGIPSISRSIRILLLGQTDPVDAHAYAADPGLSVLDYVVRNDKRRERLLHEEEALLPVVNGTATPGMMAETYRRLAHARLELKLDEARQIAIRRSGARGAKARRVLNDLEVEVDKSSASLTSLSLAGAPQANEDPTVEQDAQRAVNLLTEVQAELENISSATASSRARVILLGLGFTSSSLTQPVSTLSGGWRTRCSMASALFQPSDVLLLDEPTNFLDLPSVLWLESYIQSLPADTIVVTVTHDRAFADSVVEELLVLREQKLERFRGNLSAYETDRHKQWKYLTRMQAAQEKQKAHMQASIASHVQSAKRTGDDKKLKQAASRKKKLDDRMGLQVSAKGGRFKLNRDLAGYHTSMRGEIEVPEFDPPVRIMLPDVPDLRFPGALVALEGVDFAYGKDTPMLEDVGLTIHLGERVGVVGLNGAGKSTLVGLVMGTLKPTKGMLTSHSRAKIRLYSQQAVTDLEALAAAAASTTDGVSRPLTALSHLLETSSGRMSEQEARAVLSGLGLVGRTASDVPVSLLSGGQKVRLALAMVLWDPPHLLVLDEMTTHLDSDTITALAKALRRYEGAILVVSHDRWFLRCVVEGAPITGNGNNGEDYSDDSEDDGEDDAKVGVIWRVNNGKLKKLVNGIDGYERLAAKASPHTV